MTTQVNIPRDIEDPFYRYKMPILQIKIEGKGNGIKTIIPNLTAIADALGRHPDYILKFFGFIKGTATINDNKSNRYIINGSHNINELNSVLDKFIELYILCKQCRNPETLLNVSKEKIYLKCKACGVTNPINVENKLSSLIINNHIAQKIQNKDSPSIKNISKENITQDTDWMLDTCEEAVNNRRVTILGYNKLLDIHPGNPIPFLKQFWLTNPSDELAIQIIEQLVIKNKFNDNIKIKIIFGSLFEKNHKYNFKLKLKYLKLFIINNTHKDVLLKCLDKFYQIDNSILTDIPSIIHAFWKDNIIDEDDIYHWYDTTSDIIKETCKEFLTWIKGKEKEK